MCHYGVCSLILTEPHQSNASVQFKKCNQITPTYLTLQEFPPATYIYSITIQLRPDGQQPWKTKYRQLKEACRNKTIPHT
jgi:hypothetical protein